uniref:Prolamin-like domain-containing protein n=1 Tax=Fagus sylvatica TaxID=28930 RepID=A0A2N9I0G4_FAGSY
MGSVQQKFILLTLAFAVMASTPALSYHSLHRGRPLIVFPESDRCWKYITRVQGCQHEIFAAFGKDKGQFNISAKCCQAIQGLPRGCGIWIFGGRAFLPSFSYNVHNYCAAEGFTPTPPPINN